MTQSVETSDQSQKLCAFDNSIADKICCVSGPQKSEFDPWLLKRRIKSTRKNIIKKAKEKDGKKIKTKERQKKHNKCKSRLGGQKV